MDPPDATLPLHTTADVVLGKSRILVAILYAGVAAEALITVLDLIGIALYPTWSDLDAEPDGLGELGLLTLLSLGGLAAVGLMIASAVLFCIWIRRANRNARALGALRMEFTPGWCVGWWFVPIANLWKPYQAVREVYRASKPESGPDDWQRSTVPGTFALWWSTWLISSFIGNLTLRLAFSDDPEIVTTGSWVSLGGVLVTVPACIAVVQIIEEIEAMQQAKQERQALV